MQLPRRWWKRWALRRRAANKRQVGRRRAAGRGLISCRQSSYNSESRGYVSRPVEELLEFNTLKEIVSGFTTCAPGRRATEATCAGAGCCAAWRGVRAGGRGDGVPSRRGGAWIRFARRSGGMARAAGDSRLGASERGTAGRGDADGKCFAGAADVQRRCRRSILC